MTSGDDVVYRVRGRVRIPESNSTLERFLEAEAGWISDMEGYFKNQVIVEPDQPYWHLVGQVLFAGEIYE